MGPILTTHLEQPKSYIAKQLKLRHWEKVSKRQNKGDSKQVGDFFSNLCGLFRKPELYSSEPLPVMNSGCNFGF